MNNKEFKEFIKEKGLNGTFIVAYRFVPSYEPDYLDDDICTNLTLIEIYENGYFEFKPMNENMLNNIFEAEEMGYNFEIFKVYKINPEEVK